MLNAPFASLLGDVRIDEGPVPGRLDSASASGVLWQAGGGRFLMDAPGAARYFVTGGSTIRVERKPDAPAQLVERFLGMAPLAALLYQRGVLACHASAVATKRGAVLIAGVSGCGKSTLAAALVERGCRLLADDTAAVVSDTSGATAVGATERDTVLWPDAMRRFSGSAARRSASVAAADSVPLCAVVRLAFRTGSGGAEDGDLTQHQRFEAVGRMLRNGRIAEALLNPAAFLKVAGALARSVPFETLFRSTVRWDASHNADALMERWG